MTDPTNGLTFPDLTNGPFPPGFGLEDFQPNLINPEPTVFLSPNLPVCSIICPTETQGAATAAFNGLRRSGLFNGQSAAFFAEMNKLAALADMTQPDI